MEATVPRYYFDTAEDGDVAFDQDGLEVSDLSEAYVLAMDALPDMARQSLPDGEQKDLRVIVRDEHGKSVLETELRLNTRWIEGHNGSS